MKNIALAMVSIEYNGVGVKLDVDTPNGSFAARVVDLPFYDSNKNIAKN
jgi:glycine cleavage system aminomethyltransferase T